MKPIIPYGGFLACQTFSDENSQLLHRLKADATAHFVSFGDDTIVLAAWSQFAGQGLWQGDAGAVAYDIALTNQSALCQQAGLPLDADQAN